MGSFFSIFRYVYKYPFEFSKHCGFCHLTKEQKLQKIFRFLNRFSQHAWQACSVVCSAPFNTHCESFESHVFHLTNRKENKSVDFRNPNEVHREAVGGIMGAKGSVMKAIRQRSSAPLNEHLFACTCFLSFENRSSIKVRTPLSKEIKM